MKKVIALLISLTLVMSLLAACGSKEASNSGAKAAKTGLSVITSLTSSKEPGEKDGNAQIDSYVVGVLVGEDGKILKCEIDTIQTKVAFSAEGKIITELDKTFQTKQELKEGYNMKGVSGIGKEWYEQANALATYVVGKTADEVKNIALSEDGVPTDTDLAASVTVKSKSYIDGILKAIDNAQDLGAKATDKLGIAVTSSIANSKDATAEADGQAQAYCHYAAVTVGTDGKITSMALDASQGAVKFNAEGKITSDLTAEVKTKQELKEGYNMKGASGISKEWYEQANAYAEYVVGKTAADVKGIAVTDGVPSADDLKASVTVTVTDWITATDKAIANAR